MTDITATIARLRDLLAKARDSGEEFKAVSREGKGEAVAQVLAASLNALPALLDELDRLRKEHDGLVMTARDALAENGRQREMLRAADKFREVAIGALSHIGFNKHPGCCLTKPMCARRAFIEADSRLRGKP